MKAHIFKAVLLALTAFCLHIDGSAQIIKTVRGVPCSYDTCVSINLSNYRQIRQQFINRDSLITSLKRQIEVMDMRGVKYDSLVHNLHEQVSSFNNSISRKDSLILSLKGDIQNLAEVKTVDPTKWYQRPATWIGGAVGIVIGVLVSSFSE